VRVDVEGELVEGNVKVDRVRAPAIYSSSARGLCGDGWVPSDMSQPIEARHPGA
jgi:hypothetical protein